MSSTSWNATATTAPTTNTGPAIGLTRDVARIYEGTLDAPHGGYVAVPSSQPTTPEHLGQPAVIVPAGQVKTLLAALDDAAEYKRDGPERALTAPTNPAPPANGACKPPLPTTS
jgi:hypothetical protein